MKNRWIHIAALLLMVSCGEELIDKPDNLIPKDKMINIIEEMAVINAAKSTNADKLRKKEIDPTDFILKKYEVDSLQFVESDRYYVSKPVEYKDIYETVEKRLDAKGKEMGETKRIRDSISLKNQLQEAQEKARMLNEATDSLP
ncbi:DUF4296 domain-containing protein [Aggregatimonas sangjinii]|uniref:DUF4296 domain-containing protein n=1 Tax=Aggregatimonas sangjinii TaxID=2583587 RepID=A0A5B7SPM7_9FLAO|nr:DUF4296 domain-containing protein [Aggregatimonas sangjinii]QCW98593.1 DUF4296 domain-containing protein [Aggregatimonas sangjinii]